MDNSLIQQFPAPTRIAQMLQDRIVHGLYLNGSWLPAERDLAIEFAVSRPVVRAALNLLQEEGWIVRESGCRPRVHAPRSMDTAVVRDEKHVSSTVQTIAVVVPHQPVFVSAHAILCGINRTLQQKEAPYRVTVLDSHPSRFPDNMPGRSDDLERSYLEKIEADGDAGAIIWHLTGEKTQTTLRKLQRKGVALVFVDRQPVGLDCDYVGVDNRTGVLKAVEYLLELGHRRIGYLSTFEKASTVNEREESYRETLISHDIRPVPELTFAFKEEGASIGAAVDYYFSLPEPPTALVCCNDLHAFAFIREARARGYRIPEDISVIGFDDIECLSPHVPTLTTIHQPFYQIGQRAAELLLRRLTKPGEALTTPYQHIVLPTSLVARSTCRALGSDGN